MRIAVGADHAGVALKRDLLALLEAEGHKTLDLGSDGPEPVDYPDFARAVGEAVARGEAERGLLVCGSGVGTSMAANKIPGVRAALRHDTYSARQGVEHDDVNVLCLGARVVGPELAAEIVRTWLGARFSGEERHVRRLEKLRAIEAQYCRGE